MSGQSRIEWTDSTWNPVRGCTKISQGCKFCYAETFAERFRGVEGHPFAQGFDLRLIPEKLEEPLRWKKPRKIFVNSMSDLFHEQVGLDYIQQIFEVMRQAHWHTFQILTKRSTRLKKVGHQLIWSSNVWIGVSVESSEYTDRICDLRHIPAALRFISIEPLLGPIPNLPLEGINWVIVGGESGRHARPMELSWARDIRDQCHTAGVAFFLKQLGGRRDKRGGHQAMLDGCLWQAFPACSAAPSALPAPISDRGSIFMPRTTTLWPLEPHSIGKHSVLRVYLNAWLPILGTRQPRILLIDGFAGPGEYTTGEEGSPLIALKVLKEHSAKKKITAEVVFIFMEKEPKRLAHLEALVDAQKPHLPSNAQVHVIPGAFDQTVAELCENLMDHQQRLAPAFVMLDPFGVSDTPMSLISRLLSYPRCEVYISFMYEAINRFGNTREFAPHLDEWFGCSDWRNGLTIEEPEKRKDFFYGLYEHQLRQAGAKHVVYFELYEGQRLVYAIFFGTQHRKGCDRMKEAIWKVDPWGDFAFHGTKSSQLTLGLPQPDFSPLRTNLQAFFHGKGWVDIQTILDYVASDRTDYYSGQVRRYALIPMEQAGEIEIDETPHRRRSTYPAGTRLRFI